MCLFFQEKIVFLEKTIKQKDTITIRKAELEILIYPYRSARQGMSI